MTVQFPNLNRRVLEAVRIAKSIVEIACQNWKRGEYRVASNNYTNAVTVQYTNGTQAPVIWTTCTREQGKSAGSAEDGTCFGNCSGVCKHSIAAARYHFHVIAWRRNQEDAIQVAEKRMGRVVKVQSTQGKQRVLWAIVEDKVEGVDF